MLTLSGTASAATIYDPGLLDFSTANQSIWATGDAFVSSESVFLGTEWTDRTATIGGFTGEKTTTSIPNPAWDAWNLCTSACGPEPAQFLTVTSDNRTGAELNVLSSGKLGMEFGYTVNSGSVDADVDFSAQALLPDLPQEVGQIIDLNTSSSLDAGLLLTQSPKLEAYVSAIMNLSGSIDAEACLLGGCAGGQADLPDIALDQRVLSVDANSIKILDGVLPGNKPVAQIPLANQSLTVKAGVTISDPPVPGIEVKDTFGTEVFSSFPEGPKVTTDIVKTTIKVPNVATAGLLDADGLIKSSGRDNFLDLQFDVDGILTVGAGSPPVAVNFDLVDTPQISIGASGDLVDVDVGPVLGIRQDFELIPTLMASLEFSNSILIDGMTGLQDSWTGAWSDLPTFSLLDTTTFTPTYWVDVVLRSDYGLDLALTGTFEFLKIFAKATVGGVDFLKFGPLSINGLLGLGNTLLETDLIEFSIAINHSTFVGFNQITGSSFTIDVLPTTGVPAPGVLWLFLPGLVLLILVWRRNRGGETVRCA